MRSSPPLRLPRLTLVALLAAAAAASAAPPPGYYTSVERLSGSALRTALHARTQTGHSPLSYAATATALRTTDRDAASSANVILVYSGASVPASWWINDLPANDPRAWNREHLWPRSRGVDDSGPDNADLFNLRACDVDVNNRRGDRWFDTAGSGASADPEATSTLYSGSGSICTPREGDRGYIARALFYMDVRYDGAESGTTDLTLVETPSGATQMGRLSTLLAWHQDHPPSAWEIARNDAAQAAQGNRNPFIDAPDLADAVFITSRPTLGGWRIRWFTFAQLADPAASGLDSDLDADGLVALAEFGLQSDPTTADAHSRGPTAGRALVLGTDRLTLTYRRLTAANAAAEGISYAVEWTGDYATWSAPAPILVSTVPEGPTELVTVADPSPGGNRAARLRITRQ